MAGPVVAAFIRAHSDAIAGDWLRRIQRQVPETRALSRPALIDHLPELLAALADWVDGDTAKAGRGFTRLAEGHALQRLGHGVSLEALTEEYVVLREVLMTHLLAVDSSDDVREQLTRLDAGLDHAIQQAVLRYARQRDEFRERFISILGHDLRNPLSAITMAADLMVHAAELPPRYVALGARVQHSAGRMQRMVEDLLGFAHGHLGGGIPVEPLPDDLGEIVRTAVDEAAAANPRRTITMTTSGDLRGVWDRARVQQAIGNLIGNAIEHGEDPVTVIVRADGPRAVITEVTNRGEPIPPAALPTLFEAFRGGDRGARRRGTGVGLGLYIVREIARAHGATIDVTSTAAAGTRFTVRWPRAPSGSLAA